MRKGGIQKLTTFPLSSPPNLHAHCHHPALWPGLLHLGPAHSELAPTTRPLHLPSPLPFHKRPHESSVFTCYLKGAFSGGFPYTDTTQLKVTTMPPLLPGHRCFSRYNT